MGFKKLKDRVTKIDPVPQTPEIKRVNIGVTVRLDLWRELRALSIKQGYRGAGKLLDEAITDLLKKNK